MPEKLTYDERLANRGPVIIDVFEGEYPLDTCATVVFLHWVKDPKEPKQGVIVYATDEGGLSHQMLLEYA